MTLRATTILQQLKMALVPIQGIVATMATVKQPDDLE